jgi:hypothetical protein
VRIRYALHARIFGIEFDTADELEPIETTIHIDKESIMIKRTIAAVLAVSGSLFAAQAFANGNDVWYQFGYDRHAGKTVSAATQSAPVASYVGYDVDYVFGSNARIVKDQPVQSALQIRDALGAQAGA